MGSDNKQVDLGKYIDALTREVDDFEAKGYEFTRDADPTSTNDMWSEEFKAFADMATIESLFYSEDWVYIVVDLIAQKISSQKLLVMKKTINDDVESIDYADNHSLNDLIENPNEFQDYHSWMYNLITQYILLGNAIVWHSKRTKDLITLRTSQIQIDFDSSGSIDSYILYNDNTFDGQNVQVSSFKKDEIIHIRRPNPVSLIWGLSPFVPGRKSILFNRYSTDYLNSFYLKQATPGMIVEMDRQVNEATALRQLRTFESAYTGRRNQRRTMILPKGVTAKPSSHTIADQRIVELIDNNREAILALLKVPKHEVGLQDSGSLGSEEYKTSLRNFWESTLKPTMRMVEGSLNKYFKKYLGEDYFLQFDISDVEALQENALSKAEIATQMLAAGASVNEVRSKIFDLTPSTAPDSDTPFVLIRQSFMPDFGLSRNQEASVEPDEKKNISDPNPEERLINIINGRKKGWIKSIDEQLRETSEGKVAKHFESVVISTLQEMWVSAANVVRKNLKSFKAKDNSDEDNPFEDNSDEDNSDEDNLELLILRSFKEFQPVWESEYVESLSGSVDLGYDQQLELILNSEDRDKIEVLRVRDSEDRAAILTARGIESFQYISETQTEAIISKIAEEVEKNSSVTEISAAIKIFSDDPENFTAKASTIARTETLTAVSIGQGASIKNASEVIKGLRKAWLNISGGSVYSVSESGGLVEGDGRIRDKHLSQGAGGVSGEIVGHDQTFSNGLRWPRDVNSSDPSEVINCRCTVVMLSPGEDL